MQAGVRDARAARQPALQPAQQDPRDLAADRGLPLRGADAARRQHQALGRVRGRRRPLHGLPQVPDAVPGRHRLRRRVDRTCATCCARWAQKQLPARQRGGDVLPQRDQPADHQADAHRRWSTSASRRSALANDLLRGLANKQTAAPPATLGHGAGQGAGDPLHQQDDAGRPAEADRARAARHRGRRDYVPIIRDPKATTAETEAVFYFPGCGSERLFSQVGLATQAMLWHAGVQTVLPPGYLCCGYPQRGCGRVRQGREDHHRQPRAVPPRRQHAQLPRHQDRGRVAAAPATTSCRATSSTRSSRAAASSTSTSTCWRRASRSRASTGVRYMYHDPCHTPMKLQEPMKTVKALVGDNVLQERPLLRRIRHARRHAARHLDAGALPQGRGAAQGRGRAARQRRGAAPRATSRSSPPARAACRACAATATT